MTIYRFEGEEGRLLNLDTDTAECLLSTKGGAGQEQPRWVELYRTKDGRYVRVDRTLRQGEHDAAGLVDENEALHLLTLAERATEAGDELLAAKEGTFIEEA